MEFCLIWEGIEDKEESAVSMAATCHSIAPHYGALQTLIPSIIREGCLHDILGVHALEEDGNSGAKLPYCSFHCRRLLPLLRRVVSGVNQIF